jgi:hypothetical protein
MGDWYGNATAASASGSKTLNQIKTICQYYGWNDMSTTGTAELTNFINDTLQILGTMGQWPEYMNYDGSQAFTSGDDKETLSDTNIFRVGTVVRDDKAAPLDEITIDEHLFKSKYHAASGPPTEYAFKKSVSTGSIAAEMLVYPNPSANITLYYTWQASPALLSGGTDLTDWPDIRMWLFGAALHKRLSAIDRDVMGVALYTPEFQQAVDRSLTQSRPSYKPIVAKPVNMRPGKWDLRDIEKTFA